MPLNDSVGPQFVAFGGVVVDDVEDHFEAGGVKPGHHLLEFAQAVGNVRRIARIGRKEADGVVAPVIGQPLLEQMAVIDEGMDRLSSSTDVTPSAVR